LSRNKRSLGVYRDGKLLFIIEPVVRISHFFIHPKDAPETFRGISMKAIDWVESFCPDRVSINNGKMFHLDRFVDIGKPDRERDFVYCASWYAYTGYIPEDLEEGVSFELAPGTERVLMVGNGGLSEEVLIQPAERINRMITIEKIIERLRAIEKLLFQLAVESLSMVTRKSFGHSVYPLIWGPKIILDH
jgi:hypothetical protein